KEEFKDLTFDGKVVSCAICTKDIHVDNIHGKERLKEHIKSKGHHQMKAGKSKQQFFQETLKKMQSNSIEFDEFNLDLCRAFLQSKIPLSKINEEPLKGFLEKWTKKKVFDRTTLQGRYVNKNFMETKEKIIEKTGNHPLAFILDETQDECGKLSSTL
ncbi:uncharacterized protein B4U79_05500, partial [Dinothrombium tinctorium]